MAVSERTTRKKSKASRVHPRKPANTAAPCPSLVVGEAEEAIGGIKESSGTIASGGVVKVFPFDRFTLDTIPSFYNFGLLARRNFDSQNNLTSNNINFESARIRTNPTCRS